jgi:hypothetical protein
MVAMPPLRISYLAVQLLVVLDCDGSLLADVAGKLTFCPAKDVGYVCF